MTEQLRDIPLQEMASEYAADELSADETKRFEEFLRQDTAIVEEVALWRSIRAPLAAAIERPIPTLPAHGLAATVLRRAALERQAPPQRRLRLPRWIAPALAAAACLAFGLGLGAGSWLERSAAPSAPTAAANDRQSSSEQPRYSAAEPVAYGEDGSALQPPPATVAWRSFMPLSSIDQADANQPLPMQPQTRSWVGLWTKEAKLAISGSPARPAHLVVRIVGGSPAHNAGIRPGDMIIGIAGCGIDSPHCLGMHLAQTKPGDRLQMDIWSAADAAFRSVEITLESVYE